MEQLRLFIAFELDSGLKLELARVQQDLSALLDPKIVRWVAPDNIHLTLQFLGNTNKSQVQPITSALEQCAAAVSAFELQARGLGCFPNLGRPNNLWVGLQGELKPAALLSQKLECELVALGFPAADRGFTPHLTLGRIKREASSADRERIGSSVSKYTVGTLGTIHADAIHLISSDLRPSGPVYTKLATTRLKPSEPSR